MLLLYYIGPKSHYFLYLRLPINKMDSKVLSPLPPLRSKLCVLCTYKCIKGPEVPLTAFCFKDYSLQCFPDIKLLKPEMKLVTFIQHGS